MDFIDKVRDFARQILLLRQKMELEEDMIRDLNLQLNESEI